MRCIAIFVLVALVPPSLFGEGCNDLLSKFSPKTEINMAKAIAATNSPIKAWSHFRKKGFTLTELLVTVSIIALLVGITMPALSSANHAKRNTGCLSNLHQASVATMVYENDYHTLPIDGYSENQAWVNLPQTLGIESIKAWQCPEDPNRLTRTADGQQGIFYSYMYRGLEAMFSQRPPFVVNPRLAPLRYEAEASQPTWRRLPVYNDLSPFHDAKGGAPSFSQGKYNAAYHDGSVQRIPPSPTP